MTQTTAPVEELAVVDLEEPPGLSLLQRVILPRPEDPAGVRALYVDERVDVRLSGVAGPAAGELGGTVAGPRRLRATSRTTGTIPAGTDVSFAAYFNAFAAGYWRRWSRLTEVHLRLVVDGAGRVDVHRSKADGSPIFVRSEVFAGPGPHEVDVELDLRPFGDGGWYWFDLSSDDGELTLVSGGWFAAEPPTGRAAVAIGMPTFNRPADCVATLTAIGEDPLVREVVSAVVLPDQGARKVRDEPGFAAAAAPLGDRLHVIDQPNLGGSGGYARVMYEALHGVAADCEQILFMDDDIVLEPDSVLRAVAFSRFAREPMLVGGQMLSLQARWQLSTMGEVVDRSTFLWRNAPGTEPHHDLAAHPLRDTPWLHARTDVDYNAWWMCLIPRSVAAELGLPLPLFIKWDDAEYGLRARAAGYRTATVPGIAIWHMSFLEKHDTSDWQAYFHYRNRLVAAALHGPDNPRALVVDTLKRTVRHLLLMEYSAVALQHMAFRDFLAGPESLFATLPVVLDQIRAERAAFDDGRLLDAVTELPPSDADELTAQSFGDPPRGRLAVARTLARAALANLRGADPARRDVAQRIVPARQAHWHVLAGLDSAAVGTPDGRSVTFRHRDRSLALAQLRRSTAQLGEIARRWPELRRRYREAQPVLTGRAGWERIFAGRDA